MAREGDSRWIAPTPDDVERALEAFQRGSPSDFDRLVADDPGGPQPCSLLAGLISDMGAALDQPAKIGEYTIVREIGRGGMGVVYEARQDATGQAVAIKVIRPAYAEDHSRARLFRREIET